MSDGYFWQDLSRTPQHQVTLPSHCFGAFSSPEPCRTSLWGCPAIRGGQEEPCPENLPQNEANYPLIDAARSPVINCREKACHAVQAQAPWQRHRGSFISPGAGRGTSLSEPGRYLRVPGLVCFGVSPSVIGAEEKYPQQNKRGANDGHGPAASTKTDERGACPEQPR